MLKALLSFWISIPLAIVLGLAPGFWLCARWEAGAFDAWSWTTPGVIHITLRLPPSRAQLDAAKLQAALGDVAALRRAIAIQNAAIAANAARGAMALQSAEVAVRRAQAGRLAAVGRVRLIMAPIAGDTACARVQAFDRTFLESLK